MELLNAKQLAPKIGFSQWWVCMAKKAGMPFRYCGKTTVEDALEWMRAHSDFVAKDYLKEPSDRLKDRQPQVADKRDGLSQMHAQQIASPVTSGHPHEQAE
jgi:hypothetical protein